MGNKAWRTAIHLPAAASPANRQSIHGKNYRETHILRAMKFASYPGSISKHVPHPKFAKQTEQSPTCR